MARISTRKRILFASVPLLFLVGLLEIAVRALHLADSCPNRFTDSQVWTCDPILQFRLSPDLDVLGGRISRDGFRTHDFEPKRPGIYRILALGDSGTFGQIQRGESYGYVNNPYPLALEKLLAERIGPDRFEVLNAGVPGYNSYQGLMLLRGKLRHLDPDLITVRYGWNDHFLSEAPPGQSPYRESDSKLVVALEDLALRTALYPFVRRLGFELRAWRGQHPQALREAFARQTQWSPTVPLPDYEHNLRRIVEIGRARGAQVWLLTSPYNPTPSEEARNFVAFNNRIEFDALMAVHDQYNDATRSVGRELGAPVIDMAAVYWDNRDNPEFRLFVESDVPHPSQWGQNLEADVLYRALVARGIAVPPGAAKRRSRSRVPGGTPRSSRATTSAGGATRASVARDVITRAARARPRRP